MKAILEYLLLPERSAQDTASKGDSSGRQTGNLPGRQDEAWAYHHVYLRHPEPRDPD